MFGSIFYNLWAAIIGFSIYFFCTLTDSQDPVSSLVGSLIAAAISFIIMYPIRLLLGYVLYTPDEHLFNGFNKENERLREQIANRVNSKSDSQASTSTEFNDESSEEIAKVIQTMMLQDESTKN